MNFWDAFHDPATSLLTKLKEENPSLKSIVEDEHCLAKLRDEDDSLVTFLSRKDIIMELVKSALDPHIDSDLDETQQYNYAHHCTEVLSFRAIHFYEAVLRHEEATTFLANFLKTHKRKLNSLIVSFYCKILTSLYISNIPVVIEILKKTQFIDAAFESIGFSAVYELLVTLSARVALDDRPLVKDWFVAEDFGKRLLKAFTSTTDFTKLENIAFLWAEYIKALRELCYSFDTEDELLENIQRHELINLLLPHLFPKDKEWDWGVVINGCNVLQAFFESSYDQPMMEAYKIQRDQPKISMPDPEFVVETLCASHLADFLKISYEAWQQKDGEAMVACLSLVEYIMSTSNTKNHEVFVQQFQLFDFKKWIYAIKEDPTASIAVNSVQNIITLMLQSAVVEGAPLLKYLFDDISILDIVLNSANEVDANASLVTGKAKKAFFFRLAERIESAKERSRNCIVIRKYIAEAKSAKEWSAFVDDQLRAYLAEHLPEETVSNQTYSDFSGTSNVCVDEFMEEVQNDEDDEHENLNLTSVGFDSVQNKHEDISLDEFATAFPKPQGGGNQQPMDVDEWPTTSKVLPDDLENMFEKLKSSKQEDLSHKNEGFLPGGGDCPKFDDSSSNLNDTADFLKDLPQSNADLSASLNDTDDFFKDLPQGSPKKVEEEWPTSEPPAAQGAPDLFKNLPKKIE